MDGQRADWVMKSGVLVSICVLFFLTEAAASREGKGGALEWAEGRRADRREARGRLRSCVGG